MHSDLVAQQPTHLFVRDRRVGQRWEDHLQQQLACLTSLGPLHQRLVGLGLRP
jgi:hypothetical protein